MADVSLEIRPAVEADLVAILGLYAQPDFDGDRVISLERALAAFRRMREYPDYSLYVAVHEGKIVGTFCLLVMEKLTRGGTFVAIVDDLIVDAEHRNRKIGTQIMRFAMQLAREKRCYKLALSTKLRRTDAHRFYESLGFEKHGYSYIVEL